MFRGSSFPTLGETVDGRALIVKLKGAGNGVTALLSELPLDLVSRVVTLDLFFSNFDRSGLSGNLLEDDNRRIWIVDHGSCRFLFPLKETSVRKLPAGHIFTGREDTFDSRRLQLITPELIMDVTAEFPDAWLLESQLTRRCISHELETRLRLYR